MAITADNVRRWIRDLAERNNLLDDVEFSTEDINEAILFSVAAFNETPVFTSFNSDTFPFISCLMYGTVARLYRGAAFHQARNHLTYATGGTQIDDMDRSAVYTQLAQSLEAKFEEYVRAIKNQLNLASGWGNVSSEYASFGFFT